MKITQEEKARGEKDWRRYQWQKHTKLLKSAILILINIFAILTALCYAAIYLINKQQSQLIEDAIRPLMLRDIFFILLLFIIVSLLSYLWLMMQKRENFQWIRFCFLRKDFTPHIYYALCIYNGRFEVCKVFAQAPLCNTWKLGVDSLIEVEVKTAQRQNGTCKDEIYAMILKMQLGFEESEITIPLLESIFADVNAFIAEVKEAMANAIKGPLQNLGWGDGIRMEPEKIQKACSGIVINVQGVNLYIKHANTPQNVANARFFHRPQRGDLRLLRQKMEQGLQKAVQLLRKVESKE